MEKLEVKYRTWYKAIPPKRIKLEVPGWAGDSHGHSDGDKPQPWHCPPFVDGSTYGLELIYPFQAECRVTRRNGKVEFNGDFAGEAPWGSDTDNGPPFSSFAPGHYGFTSSLDILPPEDYCIRVEPHPRFFTDTTGTCPIAVSGHLQRWWARIFFVAFKSPREGEEHIFRYGEPYAQALVVPTKVTYDIKEMSEDEKLKRRIREQTISDHSKHIAKNVWKDHVGNTFDDKYKQMKSAHKKNGEEGIDNLLKDACQKKSDSRRATSHIKKRFFKKIRK